MSMQSLGFAAQSVAGRVRGHNEDAVLCLPELGLWAVADGMGGHECGEVASALALDTLRQSVVAGSGLESSIHAAHQAILAAVQEEGGRRMGSTVVAVRFVDADYEVAWIGDSRAYRISLDGIERLTRDHSWVQAMIDAGELSLAEARQHPRRNIVTQCLGQGEQALEVGRVQGSLAPGELLLLCSDGLTGELTDEQIQEVCAGAATLDELVEELIGLANRLGGKDNISCIVLGRSMAESTEIDARPRNFLSRWLHSRKH
ncbi:PP2C family protein-serine/threonine phosphatase [Aquipseudomonas alcaligenes]|uniref:Protein phosphatase n=2 Tax=Aquipseudomonas alcaligenes TaxID=43263 RepID=A0ABD0AUX9_AQUAC|nr:protein phosphatase 2C domain-containing protein [Pseudomonas alcaligenes]BCR25395.1 protein phosphatase [Pseudomonas alcaligenes]GIZ75819.1 protein phosphatase [Pseudomonas alcaligenes]GIZ80246.1 protein phosphatase [Pseudomonas alcaligenes]GIZ84264.1 protein phosphatase [Pseudomonas alcaligenes]GIZ93219.1 protein phosphatase [Pseudomonas alcaligenes]